MQKSYEQAPEDTARNQLQGIAADRDDPYQALSSPIKLIAASSRGVMFSNFKVHMHANSWFFKMCLVAVCSVVIEDGGTVPWFEGVAAFP